MSKYLIESMLPFLIASLLASWLGGRFARVHPENRLLQWVGSDESRLSNVTLSLGFVFMVLFVLERGRFVGIGLLAGLAWFFPMCFILAALHSNRKR